MAKFYKFTISGSYHNSKKEICDFDAVVVQVPFTELEEVAVMHMQSRYAPAAVKKDERFKENRVHKMRQIFVDSVEVVNGGALSFVGKNIKELTDEEMQDLATAKDLRGIPLPKQQSSMSLREMQIKTYIVYSEKILGRTFNKKDPDDQNLLEEINSNFAKQPPIIVDDVGRTEKTGKVSNEEIIAQEQSHKSTGNKPEDRFTLDELKKIADQKGVKYDPNTSDPKKLFSFLYEKLYAAA